MPHLSVPKGGVPLAEKVREAADDLVPLRPPEECTILIVDDEPGVIEIISFFLENQGYQIITAEDGRQALDRVRKDKPDVVITDVNMPEIDGIEVCQRLKRSKSTRYLPVILVTAKGDTETRIRAKDAGADDFLDKPINELELSTRIRSLLRSKLLYEQVEASKKELEQRVSERTTELRDAYEQLQGMERFKSDVISNVSHELRTPLQHIKSSVSLLTMGDLSEEQAETVRETVKTSVDSLVLLIDDMLSLGKGVELRVEPMVLTDIVSEAIAQNHAAHPDRSFSVVAELENDLPPVEVDARTLTRVLYHLLDNAVKFSDEEGNVLLIVRRVDDDRVRVMVQDKGIGISEEDRERVFEPFYQVDTSPTRRYPGAGVGLALVSLVLKEHGVKPHLESTEGEGTTFWFDLPAVHLD